MQHYPITTDFIKQFRLEELAYPGNGEKKYANFFFRQFAGSRNEISIIELSLSEKLSDKKSIGKLIEQLKEKDLPDLGRFVYFMQALRKQIFSYAQNEPYTSLYYRQFLPALEQCTGIARSFHDDMQKELFDRLKMMFDDTPGSLNDMDLLNGGDIEVVLKAIDSYAGQMQQYLNYFRGLLDKESENGMRISVTSKLEEFLLHLVSLIENIILDSASTSSLLAKWQTKLVARETQELYN